MNTTLPLEPPSQHMQALERANLIRLARSRLKAEVSRGQLEAAEVIREPPPEAKTMEIGELLRCQRRWGDGRCRRFLAPTLIGETKRLDSLTERQRCELVTRLSPPRSVEVAA